MPSLLKQKLLSVNIPEIDKEKNYWFVRTYGGELYDYYTTRGIIGIGINNISPRDIAPHHPPETHRRFLANKIEQSTEYKSGEATKWANQLISFYKDVRIGDTVIIPDKNSDYLAIGTVTSEPFLGRPTKQTFKYRDRIEEYPWKRRQVTWEKVVEKSFFKGDLRNLITSQQAITNANFYSETIESAISPLFIKNDKMFFVLQLGYNEDINAFELERFLSGLTYFYKEFCNEFGYKDDEELYIKIKLQSEGKSVFKTLALAALAGLCGLVLLCNNNNFKIDAGPVKMEGKSDGLLESIQDFLDRSEERRQRKLIFEDSLRKMQAKPAVPELPEDSTHNLNAASEEDDGENQRSN